MKYFGKECVGVLWLFLIGIMSEIWFLFDKIKINCVKKLLGMMLMFFIYGFWNNKCLLVFLLLEKN